MYKVLTPAEDKVIGVHVEGTLSKEDYDNFELLLKDTLEKHGKARLLVHLENFEGWDSLAAAWKDLELDVRHYSDFEKLAVVGENRWQEWGTKIAQPFTRAKVRYFDHADLDAAWKWIHSEANG